MLPLHLKMGSYHNASRYMCKGVVILGTKSVPCSMQTKTRSALPTLILQNRTPFCGGIIYWKYILLTSSPGLTHQGRWWISNSIRKEILIHHGCISEFFNIWECIIFSGIDNTDGLWWQKKVSVSSTPAPWEHRLHLRALHHQYHHYVPCQDF